MKLNPFRTCLAVSATALLALATVLPARADYSSTVMSFNPVGYWRLNDTTPLPQDSAINLGSLGTVGNGLYSGGAIHGVDVSGALAGSSDTAVNFPSPPNTGKVQIPWNAAINPAGAFTVECWANSTAAAGGSHTLVLSMVQGQNAANGNDRSGWCLREVGGDLQFVVGTTTSTPFYYYFTAVGVVTAGIWQHIVAVYDGATPHLFIDGVEAALTVTRQDTGAVLTPEEIAAVRVLPNLLAPTIIAQRGYDTGWYFDGQIDEMAIYGSALSATDIVTHYQNGTNASRLTPYQSVVLANQPVVYYRLNEPAFTFVAPPAVNNGSWAAGGNGAYYPGSAPLAPGVPYEAFGTNNTGCRFAGIAGAKDGAVGDPATPGSCIKVPAQSGIVEEMTITCWIKRDGDQIAWRGLVTQRDSDSSAPSGAGNGTGITIGDNNASATQGQGAELRMLWNKGDVYWQYDPQLYTPNQQWAFCAVVFSLTNRTVYLNTRQASQTVEAAGTTMPQTPHDLSVNPIFIGYDARGPYYNENSAFQGTMDEVAIFNKALTTNEIMQIYAAAQVPPIILVQPVAPPPPVYDGMSLSLSVVADLTATLTPLGYQWTKDGLPIPGQTGTNYTVNSLAVNDSGSYAVVITNAAGATTSSVVALSVQVGPPVIAEQPKSITRYESARTTFSVVAWGSAPISYQWTNNAGVIPGATNASYTIASVTAADAGNYGVRVSNRFGTTNSATASLTVLPVTNYATAAMAGNPIAYYRLNETSGTTAVDFAGGLPGTLNGPIVMGDTGPQPPTWTGLESTNTAFQFDGASTRVQLPSFNLQTNQMTIVAWINPAGPQSDQTGILVSRVGDDLGGFFLNHNGSDALSYVWAGSGSWDQFQSGLVPVVGQWNFAALVIDPQKGTVYLDSGDGSGLQSASFTGANKTVTWSSPNIGVDSGYTRWFSGSIDEVAVYDRALSPAEIANLDLLSSAGRVAPRIMQQPTSQTVYAGQSAAFSVGALGALPLTYQWHRSGTNIPGATSTSLTLANAYFTDAGSFDVLVSNPISTSNSQTATLTVLAPPTFANLTNELVLHLAFDGNYSDSSGRGNNAAAVNSPTFVAGKLGQGFHFNTDFNNGILNYATLGSPTPADLLFGTSQNFSVSYWIRFTGSSIDLPVFSNNDCGEGCVGFYFGPAVINNNGGWAWSLCNSSYAGPIAEGAANSINNGNWHNVVSTFDRAGSAFTYLDGVMVDTRPINTFIDDIDSANPINIGQVGTASYGANVVFGADVDDLGVWRRALSPTEAESIYIVGQNYGRTFDQYGPVMLSFQPSGAGFDLIWQAGTLLECDTVNGTYVPVSGASAPYYHVTPTAAKKFYRVRL